MFLAAQIPLADARPFVAANTFKLARPDFELGVDDSRTEFFRAFGAFEERRPGVPVDWPAEDTYCNAGRAVRFSRASLAGLKQSIGGPGHFVPAFRRYLSNGMAVSRIEIAFAHQPVRLRGWRLERGAVEHLFTALADMDLTCRTQSGLISRPLADSGRVLAAHVLASSTQWASTPDGFQSYSWWIAPGRPLLLVQCLRGEIAGAPPGSSTVPVADSSITLHYTVLDAAHGRARVWLLEHSPDASRSALRALRLHLFRLHSERVIVSEVMRHIADGRLALPANAGHGHPLVLYLEAALGFLSRRSVYGNPQSPLLQAAYEYEDVVMGPRRTTLLNKLDATYRTLRDRAAELTRAADDGEFPL